MSRFEGWLIWKSSSCTGEFHYAFWALTARLAWPQAVNKQWLRPFSVVVVGGGGAPLAYRTVARCVRSPGFCTHTVYVRLACCIPQPAPPMTPGSGNMRVWLVEMLLCFPQDVAAQFTVHHLTIPWLPTMKTVFQSVQFRPPSFPETIGLSRCYSLQLPPSTARLAIYLLLCNFSLPHSPLFALFFFP